VPGVKSAEKDWRLAGKARNMGLWLEFFPERMNSRPQLSVCRLKKRNPNGEKYEITASYYCCSGLSDDGCLRSL